MASMSELPPLFPNDLASNRAMLHSTFDMASSNNNMGYTRRKPEPIHYGTRYELPMIGVGASSSSRLVEENPGNNQDDPDDADQALDLSLSKAEMSIEKMSKSTPLLADFTTGRKRRSPSPLPAGPIYQNLQHQPHHSRYSPDPNTSHRNFTTAPSLQELQSNSYHYNNNNNRNRSQRSVTPPHSSTSYGNSSLTSYNSNCRGDLVQNIKLELPDDDPKLSSAMIPSPSSPDTPSNLLLFNNCSTSKSYDSHLLPKLRQKSMNYHNQHNNINSHNNSMGEQHYRERRSEFIDFQQHYEHKEEPGEPEEHLIMRAPPRQPPQMFSRPSYPPLPAPNTPRQVALQRRSPSPPPPPTDIVGNIPFLQNVLRHNGGVSHFPTAGGGPLRMRPGDYISQKQHKKRPYSPLRPNFPNSHLQHQQQGGQRLYNNGYQLNTPELRHPPPLFPLIKENNFSSQQQHLNNGLYSRKLEESSSLTKYNNAQHKKLLQDQEEQSRKLVEQKFNQMNPTTHSSVPHHADKAFIPGEAVDADLDDSNDEDGDATKSGKRGRPRKHAPKIPLPPLYVFIRNLLHNRAYNPRIVTWVNEMVGIFKVNNTAEFARTWGRMKSNRSEEMNYEKMSRAMRYHYGSIKQGRKGHLAMVKEKRLVYRFGELAINWKRSEVRQDPCDIHDLCRHSLCLWTKE